MKTLTIKKGSVSVKIYHTPSGNFDGWTVSYFDTDGKRKRIFRADKNEARQEAEQIATRLSTAQTAVLQLTNDNVAEYVRANLVLKPLGKNLDVVCYEYQDAVTRLAGTAISAAVDFFLRHHNKKLERCSIPDAVTKLLEEKMQDGLSARHRTGLKHRLIAFSKTFQGDVADLTATNIDTWLRAQQTKQEWTGRTRNHYRSAISNLASFCKGKFLPRDWAEMDHVKKAIEEDGEIQVFTPGALKKLLLLVPDELLPFVCLGAFSGPRPSEIQRAQWQDLHTEAGEFFIGQGKVRTAGHRVAPLLANCVAWLKPVWKELGPVCALPDPHHPLQEIAKAAGVEWVHDGLRHSFISYRRALIGDLPRISGETGTDVKTLQKRYCKPVPKADAEQWFALTP